ncbi:CCHC-type domain-containing protein [Trichonephila clavipes]|uniref:CCHC-type domain-containing protein n=1 Tax=Trichonephila clavipes TaxID=2585209 RepID=A0A8X6T8R7_TRICX|nr:CCHC-type domain-containing protein [Trichonephila clavipes]
MDEQLKALLERINALKSGQEDMQKSQEETTERMENMQRSQEETKERMENMQRSQEETKNELKEGMQKGLDDTKNELKERMEKCQEELKDSLEKKIDNVEEKINSVEEKITLKVEEKIAVVEEKIEKKVEPVEERIREQVDERIEGVVENFSLISQRMEDLKKKLLAGRNENKSKSVHVSAFPEPVLASPVPVPASPISVKLSTYDGKTNWEVYKTQFPKPMDGMKGSKHVSQQHPLEPEILQGIRTSADENKTPENRRKLSGICLQSRKAPQLGFLRLPSNCERNNLFQYFVDGLKEGEIQKAVRMANVQDLKSALLYALKVEATNEASYRDSHSV